MDPCECNKKTIGEAFPENLNDPLCMYAQCSLIHCLDNWKEEVGSSACQEKRKGPATNWTGESNASLLLSSAVLLILKNRLLLPDC